MMGLELRLFCLGSQGLAPAYSYFYYLSELSGPGPRILILLLHIHNTLTAWLFCLSSQGLAPAYSYFYYLYTIP